MIRALRTSFPLFLFVTPLICGAQIKYEREYDLRSHQVPQRARSFVDSCCAGSRVKWYGEESLTGKSVEAKLKYRGSVYSIEFDTSGKNQDVEKTISLNTIVSSVRQKIIHQLDSVFSKYVIEKIQVQWIGSNEMLFQMIQKNATVLPLTLNYEIVVKGRKANSISRYELLFDRNGVAVRVSKIVQRNTDNLDY